MPFSRRDTIQLLAGASAAVAGGAARAAAPLGPDDPAWAVLRRTLGDRLIRVRSPLADCAAAGGAGADALFARLKNPYFLGDEPGLTQTLGWIDAWTSQPSTYAVAAENAADVAAAVNFARTHGVRLAVKGGGHSYFGNSNAADSLLVWTRPMQAVTIHDAFRAEGAPTGTAGVPAVSVGAGALWGRVYRAVMAEGGRYVQGGGCLTVGVAGFTTGGGFGSLSKAFGTGAANLIEAEVVTADGKIRIANAHRDPELFFALRGGGGATFGIVTRLTVATHKLPETVGAVQFAVVASSDAAWRALVTLTIALYAQSLFNPHWGEQLRFSPGRRLTVSMMFQGLTRDAAAAAWAPVFDWLRTNPRDYRIEGEPLIAALPGRRFWDPEQLKALPGVVLPDDRPGAAHSDIFWSSNLGEAGQILNAYQSAWLPAALLNPARQPALVDTLIAAAAEWSVALHTNKGLAGGAPEAIAATRATAMNPAAADAFALLICAANAKPAWPGISGHEPDTAAGRREAAGVTRAMAPIRRLVPDAGSYVSESDYFERDWQRSHWGSNYMRLLAAKRTYDPAGLFGAHHTVGSR